MWRIKPNCIYFDSRSESKRRESGETMNIFKKLLRSEFGAKRYDGYADFVHRNCGPEVRECKELYEEMYEFCSRLDSERILGMQMRLNEVMFQAFHVGRTYSLTFFVYLAAWFFLLAAGLQTQVLLGAVLAITVCFGIKTYQFITNRCAYVDARIIEIYRTVLERILILRARSQ